MKDSLLETIKVQTVKEDKTFGIINVEPLPQGHGVTLGNSLRRVLLTSLPGWAVTSAKIAGIAHEFSTIKGVKEDLVEITLNLKKIRLKADSEKPIKLKLEVKGPKEVTAKEIKVPQGVEIVNPDLVIAHLSDAKTKLEIELTAQKGVGYENVSSRKSLGIGVIPLDALYSPVRKINYKVESTRLGGIINLDKLTLEIETDGTILPSEALKEGAKNLTDYFSILVSPPKIRKRKVKEPKAKLDLAAPIEELELSTRITNALRSFGVENVGDLLKTPKVKLLSVKNLGAKSLSDIEEALKEKGLEKVKIV
ncbi:MAG: DNA-directed RNA polymerase subunit alpha [Candidatus Woykebacteria bacterium RBG_13_40_7b]|uniref:DNA-directed RNA polymerase subunit alpha n=1 Tax=Candidatus Woykebacteria bacterium RBG_13_40_7b TaxID=1802594 RepID=A0A1G1W7V5_9BACT|nr:MAG: DNA-directed RNA polymerase subunit alpha [Candidatus Woykebacteria bacterium RBG_13_40_7b]